MIKLQAGLLPGTFNALNVIFQYPVPFKVQYWCKRLMVKLEPEVQAFEPVRMKILEEFAEKDEDGKMKQDGNQVILRDPEGFNAEFMPVASREVEIDMDKIQVKLEDIEDIPLTGQQMNCLEQVMDIEGLEDDEKKPEDEAKILELVPKKE